MKQILKCLINLRIARKQCINDSAINTTIRCSRSYKKYKIDRQKGKELNLLPHYNR